MRQAVRELLEASDRMADCRGPEACRIFRKKKYCPEYCPSQPPEEVDPYYMARYWRACETLLLLERMGLRYNDLDWSEIPDLMIVIIESAAYENRKMKDQQNADKQ